MLIPDLPVGLGDEQRLRQVLLNLVGNAIKFTDAGEVRVNATGVNSHFAVSVADTGPGIPEEHQARVFGQFHQVDSSNTKAKGRTGLGLAIAKQIVECIVGASGSNQRSERARTFRWSCLPVPRFWQRPGGETPPGRLDNDRDRGTPRDAAPPTPPGIRVTHLGGSIGLSSSRCSRAFRVLSPL